MIDAARRVEAAQTATEEELRGKLELQGELEGARHDSEGSAARAAALEEEVAALSSQLSEAQSQAQALEATMAEGTQQLEAVEEQRKELERSLEEAFTAGRAQYEQLTEARAQVEALEAAAAQSREEFDAAREHMAGLEQRLEQAHEAARTRSEQVAAARSEIEELEGALAGARTQLEAALADGREQVELAAERQAALEQSLREATDAGDERIGSSPRSARGSHSSTRPSPRRVSASRGMTSGSSSCWKRKGMRAPRPRTPRSACRASTPSCAPRSTGAARRSQRSRDA